jgi:peptidyl-prolyl cis-trans isomerase C
MNSAVRLLWVLLCFSALLAAQSAALPADFPDLPDNTVIAVFDDGAKLTMGEFKNIYAVLQPSSQQAAARDSKEFLDQWALFRKLANVAEQKKLDQKSPNKEALEYNRLFILSQAAVNDVLLTFIPEPAEISKYYEVNKERYKQVKVKAIYLTFSKEPVSRQVNGKPVPSQEQAKTKAQALLAQARAGTDFVKLVRENSEDAASREKDGDFATLRASDNVPEAIRNAVFSLKQGEVSEPVEQPSGYYLLRADEISYRPESDVRNEIIEALKQEHWRNWMKEMHDSVKIDFPNPDFPKGLQAPPTAK